jgi:hypothetical protein
MAKMTLRILNSRGHTEVLGTVEEIVGEVERFMNAGGKDRYTILAEAPGEQGVRVESAAGLRTVDPESVVTLLPQIAGG